MGVALLLYFHNMTYDIVYLWVDATDPHWQQKKQRFIAPQEDLVSYGDSPSRYRNNNELYYSLHSMRKYAKDVRNVYVVTDGQHPVWLKHFPEVTLIDHQDILEHTPVFNTRALLNQVYKIPDLSDYFIIMNDDTFFNKPLGFHDFFQGDECIVFIEDQKIDTSDIRTQHSRARYVEDVLKVPCLDVLAHAAIPMHKPSYEHFLHGHKSLYHRVNAQPFRQNTGLSIQHLYHYHILHHKPHHRHVMRGGYYETATLTEEVFHAMTKDQAAFICVNDSWDDDVHPEQRRWLQAWYDHILQPI